jgi:hypothetical protein
MSQVVLLHLAAETGIKHPLRYLQCRRTVHLLPYAAQNSAATSTRFALNQNMLPMPRVPAVLHFLMASFMGVLYPCCTTPSGCTPRWVQATGTGGLAGKELGTC